MDGNIFRLIVYCLFPALDAHGSPVQFSAKVGDLLLAILRQSTAGSLGKDCSGFGWIIVFLVG